MTAAACIVQNDQIAKHVRDYPRKLLRHRHPADAGAEGRRRRARARHFQAPRPTEGHDDRLQHQRQEPRRAGIRAGVAVANQHNAFCMVHPNNVAGMERMRNYYLNNLIGNPVDTTIAAACLVFGGVIERYPNIRFYMVHGGGFTPAGARVPGKGVRRSACAARQRLSLRHGHVRVRTSGQGAGHFGPRQGHHPQRHDAEAAEHGEMSGLVPAAAIDALIRTAWPRSAFRRPMQRGSRS